MPFILGLAPSRVVARQLGGGVPISFGAHAPASFLAPGRRPVRPHAPVAAGRRSSGRQQGSCDIQKGESAPRLRVNRSSMIAEHPGTCPQREARRRDSCRAGARQPRACRAAADLELFALLTDTCALVAACACAGARCSRCSYST